MVFSIITTVYNGELFIENCIQSVLNQSHQEFELILINDGSKDRTIEIINSFFDDRIIKVDKENTGQTSSTNLGIEIATGDFILFLDADDLLQSDCLEKFEENIKNQSFKKDCVYISIENQIENSSLYQIINSTFENVSVKDQTKFQLIHFCFKYWMFPNSAFLIPNTKKYRSLRYSDSLGLDNNYEYFTRLLLQSAEIKMISGPKVEYGINLNSLSRTYNDSSINSLIIARITAANMVINYFGEPGKKLSSFLLIQTAFNPNLRWHHKKYLLNALKVLKVPNVYKGIFESKKMMLVYNIFGLKILLMLFHIKRR